MEREESPVRPRMAILEPDATQNALFAVRPPKWCSLSGFAPLPDIPPKGGRPQGVPGQHATRTAYDINILTYVTGQSEVLPSPFCRPIGQTGSTRGSCVAQSGRKCPWPPCTTPAGTRVSAVQSRASAHCQRALPRTGTEGYARPSFRPRRSTSVRHLGHAHLCTSPRFSRSTAAGYPTWVASVVLRL